MEFVDEEEEDDPVPITTFDPLKMPPTHSSSSSPPPSPLSLSIPPAKKPALARYRECQKNHAVNLGGHAVDGCGEFMPAGADLSIESLRCAACGCHRNFHRKEPLPDPGPEPAVTPIAFYPQSQGQPGFQFQAYGRQRPPISSSISMSLSLPPPPPPPEREREMMMISNPMAAMGLGSSGKKRYRTKFTPDQKEKMLQLAEKIGWRLQKQDEEAVQEFCQETGLKRKVLKVWMHNNKQTYLGKKP